MYSCIQGLLKCGGSPLNNEMGRLDDNSVAAIRPLSFLMNFCDTNSRGKVIMMIT